MHAQTAESRTHTHTHPCPTLPYTVSCSTQQPHPPTDTVSIHTQSSTTEVPSSYQGPRSNGSGPVYDTAHHTTAVAQAPLEQPRSSALGSATICMQTWPTAALCIAFAASSRASTRAARSGRQPCGPLLLLLLKLVGGHAGCARILQLSVRSTASSLHAAACRMQTLTASQRTAAAAAGVSWCTAPCMPAAAVRTLTTVCWPCSRCQLLQSAHSLLWAGPAPAAAWPFMSYPTR